MPKDITKKFFEYHLKKYGKDDIRGMGWHEEDEYSIRFDVVTKDCDLDNSSILDVGCGFGGLYKWLIANKIQNFTYLGIDIVEDMVKIAMEKNPTGKFQYADILEDNLGEFDYVFCIGTLNIGDEGYDEFVKEMLKKMIKISKKAVAYSFLSQRKYLAKGPYHFENPEELKDWIEEEFNLKAEIIEDPRLSGESCLFIRK